MHDELELRRSARLRSWLPNVLAGLAGATVVGAALIGVSLLQAESAHTRDCEEIEVVKHGLTLTLEEGKSLATSSPVRTAAEKQSIATFYRDALGRLKPRHC